VSCQGPYWRACNTLERPLNRRTATADIEEQGIRREADNGTQIAARGGFAVQADHIDAFFASAFAVLTEKARAQPDRGSPLLRSGGIRSARELTALVTIEGDLTGVIVYGVSLATADKLRGSLTPSAEDSDQASGVASQSVQEIVLQTALAIADGGIKRLAELGTVCRTNDNLVVCGFGELLLVTANLLVVPVLTRYGDMDIGVALQSKDSPQAAPQLVAASGSRPSGSCEIRVSQTEEAFAA
jgi:CheY-specific phosphatase CheX